MEVSFKSACSMIALVATILSLSFVVCADADSSNAVSAIEGLIAKVDDQGLMNSLKEIKQLVQGPESGGTTDKVLGVINAVGTALPKLSSGDGLEIAIGVLEIVKSIAEAFPGKGTAIAAVIGLVANILGLFTSTKLVRSTEDIVKEALRENSDAELEGEIEGAKLALSAAMDYLKPKINHNLTLSDASGLASKVHITLALRPIGMVKTRIEQRKFTNTISEGKQAIKFVSLFCQLFTMRTLVYTQMVSIVKKSGHDGEAESLASVRDGQLPKYKGTLKFLTEPDESTATTLSFYYPPGKDQQSIYIQTCLKYLDLSSEAPSMEFLVRNKGYTLSSLKWPTYINSFDNSNEYIEARSHRGRPIYAMRHYFDAQENGYFVIRISINPILYLASDGTWVYATKTNDGAKNEFLIFKRKDNSILITPREYLGKFFQVQGHYVGLTEGNPSEQGYFKVQSFSTGKRNNK